MNISSFTASIECPADIASSPASSPSPSHGPPPRAPHIRCRSCRHALPYTRFTHRQVRKFKNAVTLSLKRRQQKGDHGEKAHAEALSEPMSLLCMACSAQEEKRTSSTQLFRYYFAYPPILEPSASLSSSSFSLSSSCSSSSSSGALLLPSPCFLTAVPVHPISGLGYFRNFLTPAEARIVLAVVDNNPWIKEIKRRQQFYGEVYYHTTRENAALQPGRQASKDHADTEDMEVHSAADFDTAKDTDTGAAAAVTLSRQGGVLDLGQLAFLQAKMESPAWRPYIFGDLAFPTQILVNEYVEEAGIASHFEDEQAFGPVIATISLLSPILMTLTKPLEHNNDCEELVDGGMVKVVLEPNSLFIMRGDCRYAWRHGISRKAKVVPYPLASARGDGKGRRRRREGAREENRETRVAGVKEVDRSASETPILFGGLHRVDGTAGNAEVVAETGVVDFGIVCGTKDDDDEVEDEDDEKAEAEERRDEEEDEENMIAQAPFQCRSLGEHTAVGHMKRDGTYRRVSLTIRHVLQTRRRVEAL